MILKSSALLILSFIFLLFCSNLSSQEVAIKSKELRFHFGLSHNRVVDQLLARRNLQFNGTLFKSNVEFQKFNPKHTFGIQSSFSVGDVENTNIELTPKLYQIEIKAFYQKLLKEYTFLGKKSHLFGGLQMGLSNYVLDDRTVLENVTVTFNNFMGLLLSQQMELNSKNDLTFSLSLPFVGFTKREDYDGGANTQLEEDFESNLLGFLFRGSEARFISPFDLANFNILYSFNPNPEKKISYLINYQFQYLNNEEELPINLYNNSLTIGIKFGL